MRSYLVRPDCVTETIIYNFGVPLTDYKDQVLGDLRHFPF